LKGEKKVVKPVKKLKFGLTLFAKIEESDMNWLRKKAFQEHRSLASLVREAIMHFRVLRPIEK
jgi:hypothetical protein